MLSEKTIKDILVTPTFSKQAEILSWHLKEPLQNASQDLIVELLDHRLRKCTDKDVTMAIAQDLPSLKWRVKYARKDLVRKAVRDANRELEKAQMLSGLEPQASSQSETLMALEILPKLFKNKATQQWAESVLQVGQIETMVRFNCTQRQFNSKLNKVCKYARQHRQPKQSNSHAKELHILGQWNVLMNDTGTTDDDVQAFINSHQDYINEIISSPLVKFQGRLLKDFKHAGKDKYVFINLMAKREQELDRRANR